jgi:type III secretory pathway component EscV
MITMRWSWSMSVALLIQSMHIPFLLIAISAVLVLTRIWQSHTQRVILKRLSQGKRKHRIASCQAMAKCQREE